MNMDATHHDHHKQGYFTPTSIDQAQEQRKKTGAHKKNAVAATNQYSRLTRDQATLQRDSSLDHGDLDLSNHGDIIFIHGPSHKGPRAMLNSAHNSLKIQHKVALSNRLDQHIIKNQ